MFDRCPRRHAQLFFVARWPGVKNLSLSFKCLFALRDTKHSISFSQFDAERFRFTEVSFSAGFIGLSSCSLHVSSFSSIFRAHTKVVKFPRVLRSLRGSPMDWHCQSGIDWLCLSSQFPRAGVPPHWRMHPALGSRVRDGSRTQAATLKSA